MLLLLVQLVENDKLWFSFGTHCAAGEEKKALIELCGKYKLPTPLWLDRHEKEFQECHKIIFTKDDFFENVFFDSMEVDLYEIDKGSKKMSKRKERQRKRRADPCNQF